MRPIAATSMVGGVVPVPKATLLLRSSTLLLLPSQCGCMPWRGCCSQIEGKYEGAFFSCSGKSSIGKLKIRSEEHTSELQSLMRISYAVFCLKKKKIHKTILATHFKLFP